MTAGIYTLANDPVLEWLIALLNSLDRNAPGLPVCVIPYDDRLDAVRRELARRPEVRLLDDGVALARWEAFATRAWALHPDAMARWTAKHGRPFVHRLGMHRKLAAFDGPFDRFVFLDADILVLAPLDHLLEPLGAADVAAYDDQFNGLSHVFDVASPRLRTLFDADTLRTQVFCAGVWAARRSLFDGDDRARVLALLATGDAEVLYPWAPDQSLLNYMVLRLGRRVHNRFLALQPAERAETCVTCPRLVEDDHRLRDGDVPVPFLHYIGVPIAAFDAVAAGRNVVFPYRDLFLHYRWLAEPAARPALRGRPEPFWRPPGRVRRVLRRLGLAR